MYGEMRLLGLTTTSNIIMPEIKENTGALKDNIGLALLLAAIIIVCLLINHFAPQIRDTISDKKLKNKEAERQAELDRLHKIKEKNKRK